MMVVSTIQLSSSSSPPSSLFLLSSAPPPYSSPTATSTFPTPANRRVNLQPILLPPQRQYLLQFFVFVLVFVSSSSSVLAAAVDAALSPPSPSRRYGDLPSLPPSVPIPLPTCWPRARRCSWGDSRSATPPWTRTLLPCPTPRSGTVSPPSSHFYSSPCPRLRRRRRLRLRPSRRLFLPLVPLRHPPRLSRPATVRGFPPPLLPRLPRPSSIPGGRTIGRLRRLRPRRHRRRRPVLLLGFPSRKRIRLRRRRRYGSSRRRGRYRGRPRRRRRRQSASVGQEGSRRRRWWDTCLPISAEGT